MARTRRDLNRRFPYVSAVIGLLAISAGVLVVPSTNAPETHARNDDYLEINVSPTAERVEVRLDAIGPNGGPGLAEAQLTIHITGIEGGLVEVRAVTEQAGMLRSCDQGTSSVNLDPSVSLTSSDFGNEVREYSKVEVGRRAEAYVFCMLDPARILDTEGALSVLTVPTMRLSVRQPEGHAAACVEFRPIGIQLGDARKECNSTVSTDQESLVKVSAYLSSMKEYGESLSERQAQDLRTLLFGLLVGIGGGFLANVAGWLDDLRRGSKPQRRKSLARRHLRPQTRRR